MIISPNEGYNSITSFVLSCFGIAKTMTSYRFSYALEKDSFTQKYVLQASTVYQDYYFNFKINSNEFVTDILKVKVFCESMLDGLYYETSSFVYIMTNFKLDSDFKVLTSAMQINVNLNEIELVNRAESISSLVEPVFEIPYERNKNCTQIKPSVVAATGRTQLNINDPLCTPNFCFGQGLCSKIDINLFCECWKGFAGTQCQLTEENADFIKGNSGKINLFNY